MKFEHNLQLTDNIKLDSITIQIILKGCCKNYIQSGLFIPHEHF